MCLDPKKELQTPDGDQINSRNLVAEISSQACLFLHWPNILYMPILMEEGRGKQDDGTEPAYSKGKKFYNTVLLADTFPEQVTQSSQCTDVTVC